MSAEDLGRKLLCEVEEDGLDEVGGTRIDISPSWVTSNHGNRFCIH